MKTTPNGRHLFIMVQSGVLIGVVGVDHVDVDVDSKELGSFKHLENMIKWKRMIHELTRLQRIEGHVM